MKKFYPIYFLYYLTFPSLFDLNGWETFGRSEASLKLGIQTNLFCHIVIIAIVQAKLPHVALCRAFCSPVNLNVVCTRQGKVEGTQEVASM